MNCSLAGSSKPSPIYISSYSSPAREQNRRLQVTAGCCPEMSLARSWRGCGALPRAAVPLQSASVAQSAGSWAVPLFSWQLLVHFWHLRLLFH